nr:LytTR family DNA-binding domain-containing protein [Eubacterium sp.]
MLKVAVCDDEDIILKDMENKLKTIDANIVVDIYSTGESLVESAASYDAIFLDIEMPQMSGMYVAQYLLESGNKSRIVFLTGNAEYMQDAFKVKAFRYLVKPVNDDDIKEVIADIKKEMNAKERIIISSGAETVSINPEDIIFIEATHNNSIVHTQRKDYTVRKSLGEWLEDLGEEHFFRTHKGYIVSLKNIESFGADNVKMRHTESCVPIS